MAQQEAIGLFTGAVLLGAIHGIEPGHGWPVAASYALDQTKKWTFGLTASLIIGIGHLVSSITMVLVFFYAKTYFNLDQVNIPITIGGMVQIGGPVSILAGIVLVLLGIREYYHGRSRDDEHSHGTDQHTHRNHHNRYDGGLLGLVWFAFLLGFAHEEEFEIIALCAGSTHCLELMTVYALTVVTGIMGLTMLLIAGYEHYEERVDRYTPYLPVFSATVLIIMGTGFIVGVF